MLDKGFNGSVNSSISSGIDLIVNNENGGKSSHAIGVLPVVPRPAINQATFHEVYQLSRPENRGFLRSVAHATKTKCAKCASSKNFVWQQLKNRFPVLQWLPKYDFRNNFISDMAGGLTVGILHIPQGMAYSLLANVPPVVGLYVSFFPVLIYLLMGSSQHLSVGSSTIVSLMIGKIINQKVSAYYGSLEMMDLDDDNRDDDDDDDDDDDFSTNWLNETDINEFKIQVAVTACFMVGIIQCAMGLLQLGTLSVYLSDMLISGFTTGAAVQSLTSQIKELVGVKIQSHTGPLNLVYTYIDVFSNIMKANITTCIISAVTIFCIVLVNEGINAQFRHKMKIPIPIELIVIIVGTLVSYFCDFNDEYNVKIVNNIPTGIPAPKLPKFSLMKSMITDSVAIAVVVFSLSVSISKLLAKRHKYEINPTQELLSYGVSNVVGAFFSCFPCCASISRSLVQEVAGGKTQLASLASCTLMVVVLLVIAPLFATLPNCVLAAIIVVALKGMFKQVMDFKRAWKVSKLDAATWAVTFLSVVLVDVEIGLGIGILFSLLTVLVRTKRPRTFIVGNVPYTDVYLDVKKFKAAKEIEGIKVLHFSGALYFANKDHFRYEVFKKTCNPQTVMENQKKALNKQEKERSQAAKKDKDAVHNENNKPEETNVNLNNNLYVTNKTTQDIKMAAIAQLLREAGATVKLHTIVMDCSAISFIDAAGLSVIEQLLQAFEEIHIRFYLADCQDNVMEKLEVSDFYTSAKSNIFPTVHDAVVYALFGDTSSSRENITLPSEFHAAEEGPSQKTTSISEDGQAETSHPHAYVNMSFVEHL